MWKFLKTASLCAVMCGVGTSAYALSGTFDQTYPLGICTIRVQHDDTNPLGAHAVVELIDSMGRHMVTGGTHWVQGSIRTADATLGTMSLMGCLESMDYLVSYNVGATGSYATQDEMGLTFTFNGSEYDYRLVGATNTEVIATVTAQIDTTAPTITLGEFVPNPSGTGTFTSTITLSEEAGGSTAFELSDLTVGNGTATLVGSGTNFTATITPTADGTITLDVAAAVFTDDAGNDNTAAMQVSASVDTTPPTTPTTAETSIIPVEDGYIIVSGQTEANATVEVVFPDTIMQTTTADTSGFYMIPSMAPQTASGTVQITIIDEAGFRSTPLYLSYSEGSAVEETQEQAVSLMQSRAAHVITAQPGLTSLLTGNMAGGLNAHVTRGTGTFDFSTGAKGPVWAQIQGDWSKAGDSENSYFLGVFGTHYAINPNTLAGLMLQFDAITQEENDTLTEGLGYLVGPYFVAKMQNQPLYFEGRYLFGQTQNSIKMDGVDAQDFDTKRSLASLKMSGQLSYGSLILTPSLAATHLKDTQTAFTDNGGNAVAEQGIMVSDVALGLDFSKPILVARGDMILTGGISGIWSKTKGTGYASTVASDYEGGRARVHLGANYTLGNDTVIIVGANYDGIGTDSYESFGLNLGLEMKF